MKENEKINTAAQAAAETQPEDNGDQNQRTFTQEEVNRIVQDRLAKERSKTERTQQEQDNKAQEELTARESRLACREFLFDNNFPRELLECIDTSNLEEFKTKAEKLYNAMNKTRRGVSSPIFNAERPSYGDPLDEIFGHNVKHTPKQY